MTAALQRIAYQHRRLRTVFAGPLGALLPLLVLLPALTGYGAIQSLFGIDNGAMLQKIFVFICVAVAGILVGFRIPPWPVLVLFGVFATAFFIASLLDLRDAGPGDLVLIRGTAGYVYAWCVFFVDWRQVNVRSRAVSLAFAPIIAVLISVPLSISGHTIFIMHEYTGALRLAAGMPPAYLASLALFGVIGAAWLWSLGSPWGLWVSVANAGICALTGTRGATLAAGLVFVAMLIVAVLYRLRQWRVGIGVGVVGLVAGAMLFIPLFMQRSTASAHGILGFSGRTEAWSYFMRRFQEHPWTGFGPGGATVLAEESGNATIMRSFVSPHSAYVSLLVDIGAPLFIVFLAMFAFLFWFAFRGVAHEFRGMVCVIAVACAFYGAFDNLLNAPQSAVPLALVLAMATAGVNQANSSHGADDGSRVSPRRAWREAQARKQ